MEQPFRYSASEGRFQPSVGNASAPTLPFTVTFQITRRCNLNCVYCSECDALPDVPLETSFALIDKLSGVERLIISGGEPTLSKNFIPIIQYCRTRFRVVATATNATIISDPVLAALKSSVDYVDVTLDGPPAIHERVRGGYERTQRGLKRLSVESHIPISVVMVVMRSNVEFVEDVVTVADFLGARKVKLLSPIAKGRGAGVLGEALTDVETVALHARLVEAKRARGWKCRISVTLWSRIGMGHALLVHPNGDVVASPVWSNQSGVEHLGNLLCDDLSSVWHRYPYKDNHIRKYTEDSMLIA